MKGADYEREFKEKLEDDGFTVLRVAGSGQGSFCDLVALRSGQVRFIECKKRKSKPYYLSEDREELKRLKEKSYQIKAVPILAVRFSNDKSWRIIDLRGGLPKKVN